MARAKTMMRAVCPRPVLIWREAEYHKRHGEIELRIVKHLCDRSRDAVDVGANEGAYLYFMRRYARRVYAFEPIPWLAEMIAAKFGPDLVVRNVALSRGRGTARLHIPVVEGEAVTGLSSLTETANSPYADHHDLAVRTEALDDVFDGDLGFMKIDVEGHEEAVLDGARRILTQCRPRVLVEIEERHSPGGLNRVTDRFARLGYRGLFVFKGALMSIDRFDPSTMQQAQDLSGGPTRPEWRRSRSYVNNFLFLPSETSQETLDRIEGELAS